MFEKVSWVFFQCAAQYFASALRQRNDIQKMNRIHLSMAAHANPNIDKHISLALISSWLSSHSDNNLSLFVLYITEECCQRIFQIISLLL